MRERKFKAYTDEGEYVDTYLSPNNHACNKDSGEEKYNWKLLEHTGATDRKGVDIYENDIIMFRNDYPGNQLTQDPPEPHNDFGIVLWSNHLYGWVIDARFKNNNEKSFGLLIDFITEFGYPNEEWEVIGKVDDDQENLLADYFGNE